MAEQLRLRRGTTAQTNEFVGADAEVTVDAEGKRVILHDGATPGGFPAVMAKKNLSDVEPGAARSNLGLDTAATQPTSRFPYVLGSVAELASVPEGLRVDGAVFRVRGYADSDLYTADYRYSADSLERNNDSSTIRPLNIPLNEPGRFKKISLPEFTGITPLSTVSTITPNISAAAGFFDGKMWGFKRTTGLPGEIFTSLDGEVWTKHCDTPVDPRSNILKTSDGEVLIQVTAYEIHKSSGFFTNPASVTWTKVLDVEQFADAVGGIIPWGFKGYEDKFIVTTYSSSWPDQGWNRLGFISVDAGNNWAVKYDSHAIHGSQDNNGHPHGVAYDPWADTFYYIEGHGRTVGVYYSFDDGNNWHLLSTNIPFENAPTTIDPTDRGIVLTSDSSSERGVYSIKRPADRTDHESMSVDFIYQIDDPLLTDDESIIGFGNYGHRDPRTGVVYVGWARTSGSPFITASDGESANLIFIEPTDLGGPNPRISGVCVTTGNEIIFNVQNTDGTPFRQVKANLGYGIDSKIDTGRTNGGDAAFGLEEQRNTSVAVGNNSRVMGRRGVAIGKGAEAGNLATNIADTNMVAIGTGAKATRNRGIAIGGQVTTTEPSSVNIGGSPQSDSLSVQIGDESQTSGGRSVAIGKLAKAEGFQRTAVGYNASGATAFGANASGPCSFGRDASSVSGGVSVGIGARALSVNTTAVGDGSTAAGSGSMALGQGSHTNSREGIATVGDRDIVSNKTGGFLELKDSAGVAWKISVDTSGNLVVSTG